MILTAFLSAALTLGIRSRTIAIAVTIVFMFLGVTAQAGNDALSCEITGFRRSLVSAWRKLTAQLSLTVYSRSITMTVYGG